MVSLPLPLAGAYAGTAIVGHWFRGREVPFDTVVHIISGDSSYIRWSRMLSSWKCARIGRESHVEK